MPTRFKQRKRTPFVQLPRNKRRSAVVQLAWRIAQQSATDASRLFLTDHLLIDPDEPDRLHPWVDIYFVGKDRFTFWNAELITTELAARDAIESRAFDAAFAMLSAEEQETEFEITTVAIPAKRPGAPRMRQWVQKPKRKYPQFDGRTFTQECARLEVILKSASLPKVDESFTLDCSYAYGIGLRAVVDEISFDKAAIERTIAKFRAIEAIAQTHTFTNPYRVALPTPVFTSSPASSSWVSSR